MNLQQCQITVESKVVLFIRGTIDQPLWSFRSRFISVGFRVAFILFVNTRSRRKHSKAEMSWQADPLAPLQRGSAVLAPRCHCGAGWMQLWFGSIPRSWDHCRGETAIPSAAGALVKIEESVGRTGRNRDLLRLSPHTNVSPGQPQPN